MPEYIDAEVKDLIGSDRSDKRTLLLGVSGDINDLSSNRENLAASVDSIGGEVLDRLGRATLRVKISESDISTLHDAEYLKSIELERCDVGTLERRDVTTPSHKSEDDKGNSISDQVLTR